MAAIADDSSSMRLNYVKRTRRVRPIKGCLTLASASSSQRPPGSTTSSVSVPLQTR